MAVSDSSFVDLNPDISGPYWIFLDLPRFAVSCELEAVICSLQTNMK